MTALAGLRFESGPCALCRSDRSTPVAQVGRYAVPLRIVRCGACGHVYLDPRPVDADLPLLYDEAYYRGGGPAGSYSYVDDRDHAEPAALRARGRLARIEELVRPGRLLEVGCSMGAFLAEANRRGWTAEGVDLSPYAVAAARAAGLAVREGTLEAADLPAGAFRVVYMAETIEHLPDPRATVRAAARVLEGGGLLVAGTANHASLARLLRGPRWGYYVPGHLQYFSARRIARLFAEEGVPAARLRFGDDRPLRIRRAARRAAGLPAGPLSALRDALLRISCGGFSVGAGMVVYGRRAPRGGAA